MNDLACDMKEYLNNLKSTYLQNPEKAINSAKNNLIAMQFIDQDGNILPPYNGEKVNESDFTRGPKVLQYVKKESK